MIVVEVTESTPEVLRECSLILWCLQELAKAFKC